MRPHFGFQTKKIIFSTFSFSHFEWIFFDICEERTIYLFSLVIFVDRLFAWRAVNQQAVIFAQVLAE